MPVCKTRTKRMGDPNVQGTMACLVKASRKFPSGTGVSLPACQLLGPEKLPVSFRTSSCHLSLVGLIL